MNPIDFTGPVFLVFYALACLAAGAVFRGVLWVLEQGEVPKIPEVDPYLMACLREDADEPIKLAALALVERKLLKADGKTLTAEPDAAGRVRRPIEKAILEACQNGCQGHALLKDAGAKRAAQGFVSKLRELGLMPGPQQTFVRWINAIAMIGLLWGLAGLKVNVAIERGKSNVTFLILEAMFLPILVAVFGLFPHRTTVGARVVADMQTLFARLRGRAETLAADSYEASLLAGVYGFAAVGFLFGSPGAVFAAPPPPPGSGSSCSSSSCSSSSCGGGCGGGCGGCGG